MEKKQMERIARHYLGERLIRVEHTPENKPPFQVVYNSGSEYHDGMYGNNVEEMCIRIAVELKSRGWVPTHPRLEWEPTDRGDVRLCLRLDKFTQWLFSMLRWGSGRVSVYDFHQGLDKNEVLRDVQATDAAAYMVGWAATNFPNYHLPPFQKNEQ